MSLIAPARRGLAVTCSTCRHSRFLARSRRQHTASSAADPAKYDILFCGSDSFSVASLQALLAAPDVWSSIRVVAPQPKPTSQQRKGKERASLSDRPLSLYRPTLREFASDHDLPVDLIDWKTGISGYSPPHPFSLAPPLNSRNLLITASFGYILPDSFLDLFYRTHKLNVHPSLLPRWRGAAPIQWTIANGDATTGVSVQRLVSKRKGIDAGRLVGVTDGIDVPPDSTYWYLLPRLADEGGKLLVETLRRMQAGTVQPITQDPALVTKAPKIRHDTARIQWTQQTAAQICALHRGIGHQEPLWTRFNTTSPEIQLLNPTSPSRSDTPTLARDGFASIPVGAGILHKPSKALYIAAAPEGAPQDKADPQSIGLEPTFVRLEQVRPAGRKAMGVWEWYNGLSKEMKASKMLRFEA